VTPTLTAAARMAAAEDLLKRGDSAGAVELLLAIKASDPAAPGLDDALYRAYLARGQALLDGGDIDGSWAAYARAGELRPAEAAPRDGQTEVILAKNWRAMEAAWGKDDDAAIAAAEDVYRIRPDYRDVRDKLYALLIGRADRQLKDGNRDGAYQTLMHALEVKPDGPEARERLKPYTPTPTPPPTAAPVRPVQSAPAQSAPAQSAPAQSAPAQAAPAQAAPAQAAPAQAAPAQ
jgi:tetratricopeptide (TPR) repeat protein